MEIWVKVPFSLTYEQHPNRAYQTHTPILQINDFLSLIAFMRSRKGKCTELATLPNNLGSDKVIMRRIPRAYH
jgi:hypothetical protein